MLSLLSETNSSRNAITAQAEAGSLGAKGRSGTGPGNVSLQKRKGEAENQSRASPLSECRHGRNPRTDLIDGIEESTDLITWNPATVSSTATVSDSGSIRTYKAKVPVNGAEKKFLRLKLTALTN